MKTIFGAVLLVIALCPVAEAQDTQSLRSAQGRPVAVIDMDSREWQGRLLDIAKDAIVVEVQSTPQRFELASIKRVDAHGDRVLDGALKGAAFGALIAMITVGPRFAVQGALTYGLIGIGMDALNNCQHTVYRAPASNAAVKISW